MDPFIDGPRVTSLRHETSSLVRCYTTSESHNHKSPAWKAGIGMQLRGKALREDKLIQMISEYVRDGGKTHRLPRKRVATGYVSAKKIEAPVV